MDELLKPLLLKIKADKILHEVLRYERERIEISIKLYNSFHSSLQNQFEQMKEQINIMEENMQDFGQFCALSLEERSEYE